MGGRVCQAMSRSCSNSTTVDAIEYGMPSFIDIPNVLPRRSGSPECLAARTVPDPSIS